MAQDGQLPTSCPTVLRDVQLAFPTQDVQLIRAVEPLVLDGDRGLLASGHLYSVRVDVTDQSFEHSAFG